MIRKFLVPVYEKVLDVIFVVGVISGALSGASVGGVAGFFVGLIGTAFSFIVFFGIIYVLLDIRDVLRSRQS